MTVNNRWIMTYPWKGSETDIYRHNLNPLLNITMFSEQ
jgi:hypothetical protein